MRFRNLLLSAVPEEDIVRLMPAMREISLAPGDQVHATREPVAAVYFPSSTVLSAVTEMADGTSVETATIGHEGVAGLLPALTGAESHTRVFAQVGGSAIRLPADALRERAASSPALMRLMLRTVQAGLSQAEQSVACNALHDATPRLARWLLMTQDRTGSAAFPLTQDYMAIMVGVQRTTISAAASALKARGLIRYARGKMVVVDRPGLEAAACECYGAVRDRYVELGLPQDAAA